MASVNMHVRLYIEQFKQNLTLYFIKQVINSFNLYHIKVRDTLGVPISTIRHAITGFSLTPRLI